ncbi:hypothetical protein [Vibrio vulnificus]|uniref:hypothetical protein n=1 Tax=Vibrio vulnificus TaxID=672 RepID=UPI001559D6EC|nr:hypothetical protein [Vibrio vulnificus]MDG2668987.1 hypothetical protein [Vibrio parahaemolyticus]MDS1773854.1 hypothetical protein [Vibrio vulnificus]MDS1854970.1 hypothetical protein [Vibrio vulnificus]HAS6322871.1 hypothetical protein [Vibrio vulnificus]HDY7594405.1 hypothetical protein [Vibrio vulnificus]
MEVNSDLKSSLELVIESNIDWEFVISCISTLSGALAVVAGFLALHNWKRVELHKCSFALEDSFLELFRVYEKYIYYEYQLALLRKSPSDLIKNYDALRADMSNAELDKEAAYRNYVLSYDRLSRWNKKLPEEIAPHSIHNEFISVIAIMQRAIKSGEFSSFPRDEVNRIWKATRSILRKQR